MLVHICMAMENGSAMIMLHIATYTYRYTYGTHIVQKLTSCLYVYQCVYTCRCVSVNGNTNPIGFCSSFYSSKDGYVNGSEINGLQTALQAINNMFQDDIDNPCVPLMLQYLCHYYFLYAI